MGTSKHVFGNLLLSVCYQTFVLRAWSFRLAQSNMKVSDDMTFVGHTGTLVTCPARAFLSQPKYKTFRSKIDICVP